MQVFLSYQMEDAAAREDFSRNLSNIAPSIIFRDYQKRDYFDPEWRQRCSEIIRECSGTVVLIGRTTYQSRPVAWEIAETKKQQLPVLGVIMRSGDQPHIPDGLSYADLIQAEVITAVVSRIHSGSA